MQHAADLNDGVLLHACAADDVTNENESDCFIGARQDLGEGGI